MRFNSINIAAELTRAKGIEEINIKRLTNVVAFVGKNGSGKSRILDLLEGFLFSGITVPRLLDNTITCLPEELGVRLEKLEKYKDFLSTQEKMESLNRELSKDKNNVAKQLESRNLNEDYRSLFSTQNAGDRSDAINAVNAILPSLKAGYFRRIRVGEINELKQVLSSSPQLSGNSLFENLVDGGTQNGLYDEVKSIITSGLAYIFKIPNKLTVDYRESMGDPKIYETKMSYKRYVSLKKYIATFLNKDLTYESRDVQYVETENGVQATYVGRWLLDKRNFDYTEFSDGEKTLFAYALLFFLLDQNPSLNMKESIIIIDEPELHLHADSEIGLVNALREVTREKGQLIIATHSINILASLNYEEIFMVKNGVIKHPTQSTPGESLSELISKRIERLSDFIYSISTWAYVNFMAQCFTDPDVIESANAEDPQVQAFKRAVKQN